jgi:hypothetical protein
MLDKELFKVILLEGCPEKKLLPRYYKIPDINKIITIIGPRRSGKTSMLYQIIYDLKDISKDKIIYLNFEDERLSDFNITDFQKILDYYFELYPQNKGEEIYFFFDEIQSVDGWQKFIRRIYDKERCKIFITGSSAKLLSKEISTELRGRTYDIYVYPFSFIEYLEFKGIKVDNTTIYSSKRHVLVRELENYLTNGGFPEVIAIDSQIRCEVLQNYFNVLIFRDIIERYNIKQIGIVKDLLLYLVNNNSRGFSVNSYYNYLKSQNRAISKDTLYLFSDYIDNTMYFFFVPIYSNSKRKQNSNPKKCYVIDTGLSNCLLKRPGTNDGWNFENLVFIELKRKNKEVYYFKGKSECDFIAVTNNKVEAIQVCFDFNDSTKDREINGLLEAMASLNIDKGTIITKDLSKEEKLGKNTIYYIPLHQWLLSQK